jgi:4-hydroxybenzoate polyprenyltransferase
LKRNVVYAFCLPWWLLRGGRARLKQEIAERVDLDATLLPYNETFLEYLRRQHRAGRRLCLATASHQKYALAVAGHLGIFTDVVASTAKENLTGRHKLARLRELFGDRQFDYAGNSYADLALVPHAREVVLVNPDVGIGRAAARRGNVTKTFDTPAASLRDYAKALRLHQWLKNLLIFVPIVADHRVADLPHLAQAGIAFFAFGFCASSVYLLNDLFDLAADRTHPRKRYRPLAAGTVSIKTAVGLIPVLLLLAFGLSYLLLPLHFMAALGVYYMMTIAYSVWLKGKMMVDVIVLAGLYTIRIVAGMLATATAASFWLLALSMFLFLSLAMVKRYSELYGYAAENPGERRVKGRGYRAGDLAQLSGLGAASGYAAVTVLALYVDSSEGAVQYEYPIALWLLCPLLLYWISRVWVLAGRGEMHDDPIVFAIHDWVSRAVGVVGAIIMWLAV